MEELRNKKGQDSAKDADKEGEEERARTMRKGSESGVFTAV